MSNVWKINELIDLPYGYIEDEIELIAKEISTSKVQEDLADKLRTVINATHCLQLRQMWWHSIKDGAVKDRTPLTLLNMIQDELQEAIKASHTGEEDDKLTDELGLTTELADMMMLIMDLAAGFDLDLAGVFMKKLMYNQEREDHSLEYRSANNLP